MKMITTIVLALSLIKVLELECRLHKLEGIVEHLVSKADALETLAIVHEDRLNAVSEDVDKLIENA